MKKSHISAKDLGYFEYLNIRKILYILFCYGLEICLLSGMFICI